MKKTVLFQGDSITDCGRVYGDKTNLGKGYAAICAHRFAHDKNLEFFNRGVSGDRASHMRARWQEDCLDIKPDILSIAEGVNEVLVKYFEGHVVPPNDFERDYLWCIESARSKNPNLRLIIIEPWVQLAPLPPEKPWNNSEILELLTPYRKIVKKTADKYADVYIPLHGIFENENAKGILPQDIAEDGIHPTALGHYIYALHMSEALGKVIK